MKKAVIGVAIGLIIVAMIITFGQVFTVRYINVEFENSVTSTDKQELVSLADIDSNTNIFVLDEDVVKQKIEGAFPDNVIRVTDIEREFPNRVVIKVSERIAIYKIEARSADEEGYVAVDRNFQRNTIYSEDQLQDTLLVDVKGVTVKGSFVTKECYILRDIANALVSPIGEEGTLVPEEGIPYLIKEIIFDETTVTVRLRPDDAVFVIQITDENISESFSTLFEKYRETSPAEREGKVFSL